MDKKQFKNKIKEIMFELLKDYDLEEITTTGQIDGFSTPFAFTRKGKKGKKKIISTTPQSDYYDPTYKRRTKVGKLATKVANVFRGDKKDKNVNVKKKQ